MDKTRISGHKSPELDLFLREWEDESDYITAHTSGSTGRPKEIKLRKSDMIASAKSTCRYFDINSDSLLVNPLSIGYIAGKMMVVRAMVSGARLINLKPALSPLTDWKTGECIDLLPVVPSQIPGLLKSGKHHKINNLIIGGASLQQSIEQELIERRINAFCTYGMTETCSHVALRRIGEQLYHSMPGFDFETDERGCLVIQSIAFSFGQLVTNDIVELVDSRSFRWLGRADNVVNSGGIKIFPEQLEMKIAKIFNGREFYFTSRESAAWGHELVLIIEGLDQIENLPERLREILDRYECPKEIIYKEHLDRTDSGKIKRNL